MKNLFFFPYENLTSVEVLKIKLKDLTYEDFNFSLKKNNILDNHYRTRSSCTDLTQSLWLPDQRSCSGDGLILFNKECKQNKLITLMDLLEYYNKIDVKPF